MVGMLCMGLLGFTTWLYLNLPKPDASPAMVSYDSPPASWAENTLPPTNAWSAVQRGAPPSTTPPASESGRFRLVGTYFMMPPGSDSVPVRKAVLDDVQQQTQILLEQGEAVDGNQVKAIYQDYVVLLLRDGSELELWLRFGADATPSADVAEDTETAPTKPAWDEITLSTSRFGRQIAEERWILSREALLSYREELLDDPERLAALFVSMKADRIDRQIEGYRLEREGEDEFWDAVGLQESDVIRRANSMKMTRQERAEYMISEFVSNRLNVVVLDIERDGTPMKLVYYLR